MYPVTGVTTVFTVKRHTITSLLMKLYGPHPPSSSKCILSKKHYLKIHRVKQKPYHISDSTDELVVEQQVLGFILCGRSEQHPTHVASHCSKCIQAFVLQRNMRISLTYTTDHRNHKHTSHGIQTTKTQHSKFQSIPFPFPAHIRKQL